MSTDSIISIVISLLGSSAITLILSTFVFISRQEKQKYIFAENQRIYESILTFAQMVLYPKEAKYSLGVARYDIQKLSDEQNVINALNNLKISVPKLKLINKDDIITERVEQFVKY